MPNPGLILVDPYPRALAQIFTPATRARIEALGDVLWHDGPPLDAATVDAVLPTTIAVIGQTDLSRERLARAPRLRAVLNVEGNFLTNVDYRACRERRVPVLCAAPVFGPPVAELALGLALSAAREIPTADAEVRAGREVLFGGDNEHAFLLAGKTVGLVGFGNLGRSLLPLLRPFGGAILVHDPWLTAEAVSRQGAEPVGLDDLFRRSRVVFVLAPPTTENDRMIGVRQLAALADGSVVVLVSRAPVVEWDALLDAAASGRIRAAIDVFPEEPIPPGERARRTPNTILSAHRAGNVPEIWRTIGEMVADDLESILAGHEPSRMQVADAGTVERLRSRPIAP
jgi:phosphoglycerate dehydrogenase-like enzyme